MNAKEMLCGKRGWHPAGLRLRLYGMQAGFSGLKRDSGASRLVFRVRDVSILSFP